MSKLQITASQNQLLAAALSLVSRALLIKNESISGWKSCLTSSIKFLSSAELGPKPRALGSLSSSAVLRASLLFLWSEFLKSHNFQPKLYFHPSCRLRPCLKLPIKRLLQTILKCSWIVQLRCPSFTFYGWQEMNVCELITLLRISH